AAAELARHGCREQAMAAQVGEVLGNERVAGVVARGARGKGREQRFGGRHPVDPRRAVGRDGVCRCHGPFLLHGDNRRPQGFGKDQKMDLPYPSRVPRVEAMKGYGQFCPVAAASEIFAERWTPLILRELFSGSSRFSEIRNGMPLISRTLLTQRLRE